MEKIKLKLELELKKTLFYTENIILKTKKLFPTGTTVMARNLPQTLSQIHAHGVTRIRIFVF